MIRVGAWLFRHRTWLPLPLAACLLLLPGIPSPALAILGVVLVVSGEVLRLWGVHHIGVISRTRSDRLGPLVADGPFGYVRNPLYAGNIALWSGFALNAGLPWMTIPVALVLGLAYHAIVKWEEQLLETRLGDSYRQYAMRVPRWVPSFTRARPLTLTVSGTSSFNWRETFFSERGTLIAIAVGYLMIFIKLKTLG
jgi:protein-S-isoprenylcysteine O-methyltransferase Ste14